MAKKVLLSFLVIIGILGAYIFSSTCLLRSLPEEPFSIRYERASDIVYGTLVSMEPVTKDIKEFAGFKENIKKCVLKIKRSWKGKRDGEIEFYAVALKKSSPYRSERKIQSDPLISNFNYTFYLRESSDGSKIAETLFGARVELEGLEFKKSSEFLALEDLRSGKNMEEAVKRLGEDEVKSYANHQKKN
jgi:hypothetical protein